MLAPFQVDTFDILYYEFLYKSMARIVIVHVNLLVFEQISELIVIFLLPPAVGAEAGIV